MSVEGTPRAFLRCEFESDLMTQTYVLGCARVVSGRYLMLVYMVAQGVQPLGCKSRIEGGRSYRGIWTSRVDKTLHSAGSSPDSWFLPRLRLVRWVN